MQRIGKMLLALAVVVMVFGGTNAFATSRGCSLNNAKTAETADTCTVKASTGTYKVTANHSPNSNSIELIVGLTAGSDRATGTGIISNEF